jgi:hypothetical protein
MNAVEVGKLADATGVIANLHGVVDDCYPRCPKREYDLAARFVSYVSIADSSIAQSGRAKAEGRLFTEQAPLIAVVRECLVAAVHSAIESTTSNLGVVCGVAKDILACVLRSLRKLCRRRPENE